MSVIQKVYLICFFLLSAASSAHGESCFTNNWSLFLGNPGIVELNAGFTVGETNVNPDMSCKGVMADLGLTSGGFRAAAGYRAFQRYDVPYAFQYNAFIYQKYPGSNLFFGGTCAGLEAGQSLFLIMARLGVGMCSERSLPIVTINLGLSY
jgi:hypothetical protein